MRTRLSVTIASLSRYMTLPLDPAVPRERTKRWGAGLATPTLLDCRGGRYGIGGSRSTGGGPARPAASQAGAPGGAHVGSLRLHGLAYGSHAGSLRFASGSLRFAWGWDGSRPGRAYPIASLRPARDRRLRPPSHPTTRDPIPDLHLLVLPRRDHAHRGVDRVQCRRRLFPFHRLPAPPTRLTSCFLPAPRRLTATVPPSTSRSPTTAM
jgi:hypothetical protein